MEPHAIVAAWDGDRLTLDTPNQAIAHGAGAPSPPSSASRRRTSRSAARSSAAASARRRSSPGRRSSRSWRRGCSAGRSSWCFRRDQMFGPVGHRGATRQRLRLGMDGDGRLTALEHDAAATTSSFDDFLEPAANASHNLYATPGDRDAAHAACASTPARPARCARRARPRARRRSNARSTRRPRPAASTRSSSACATTPRSIRPPGKPVLVEGAARVLRRGAPSASAGPAGRSRRGRCATTAGRLVGWGMGTALFPAPMFRAEARAVLRADGTALVETSARRHGPGRLDGARADRRRRARPARSTRSSSAPAIPTIPTAASPAARATPRPRAARSSAPAATPSPGSPSSPPATRTRRSSAPATPASRRATGACTTADDPSRSESYADILARAGLAEIEGTRQRRPRPGARGRPGRCSRTARSSPRSRSIPISARSGSAVSSAPSPPGGSSTRTWRAASSAAA